MADTAPGDALDLAPAAPLQHLALLAALQDQFLASIPQVDAGSRVPWCGRWQVRHLVVHLARIHHWAAAQAARHREVPLGRGPFDLEDLYRSCALELRQTLADLGPDAIGSTLIGPGPASFWHRRQLHETLVHLWDLRTAGGLDLLVGAEVWADTVDEVVTVMQPRQVSLGRMPQPQVALSLVADDVGRAWRLGPDGDAGVTVRGTAQDLALLLWRRTRPDDLDQQDRGQASPGGTHADGRLPSQVRVDGDRAALRHLLTQPLTP